jgi:hypothetical protein
LCASILPIGTANAQGDNPGTDRYRNGRNHLDSTPSRATPHNQLHNPKRLNSLAPPQSALPPQQNGHLVAPKSTPIASRTTFSAENSAKYIDILQLLQQEPKVRTNSTTRSSLETTTSPLRQQGNDIRSDANRDKFGKAVSLSADGQILAIGAPFTDELGNDSGSVRIYRKTAENWTQIGNTITGSAALEFTGWAVSLSADGQTVAIGATGTTSNGNSSGSVRIYRNIADNWTLIGNPINGEAARDLAGSAITLSADGQVIVIGYPANDSHGSNSGKVKVFRNHAGTWTQIGNDLIGIGSTNYFGASVALSTDGQVLAVGAPQNSNTQGTNSGAVSIYHNVAGSWTPMGEPLLGQSDRDFFGTAVALSADGQTLAVSAIGSDQDRGTVHVYRYRSDRWEQHGDDLVGQLPGEAFGTAVVLSADGQTVAVSAMAAEASQNHGIVRTYRNFRGLWKVVGSITGSDLFGTALALSADGKTIAIGAPGNDQSWTVGGFVRVFEYVNAAPTVTVSPQNVVYRENSSPVPIAAQAVIRDDIPNLNGGELTIQIRRGGTNADRLTIQNVGANNHLLDVRNNQIFDQGNQIASYTGGIGVTPLTIQLQAAASLEAVQTLLQNIVYSTLGASTERIIEISLRDRDGGISPPVQRTLKLAYQPEILLRHTTDNTLALVYLNQVNQVEAKVNLTYGENLGPNAGQLIQLPPQWRIVETTDIQRDGITDLLLHSAVADEVALWRINRNGQVNALQSLRTADGQVLRTGNPTWRVIGLSDIDQSNTLDLVWHNPVSDEVGFWWLAEDGVTVKGYDYLRDRDGQIFKTQNSNWRLEGLGDFDGDGDADLLFHRPDLNQLIIVELERGVAIGARSLTPHPGKNFTIQGIADANGDQIADIYWQNADQTQVIVQLVQSQPAATFRSKFATIATSQPLQKVADFNADGTYDLFLRNYQTDELIIQDLNWDASPGSEQILQQAGTPFKLGGGEWQIEQIGEFRQLVR